MLRRTRSLVLLLAVLAPMRLSAQPAQAPAVPASPAAALRKTASLEELEAANPVRPLPESMPGHGGSRLADLPVPPQPEKARLGRWLFFDTRLSMDGTLSCASCHDPKSAFSEKSPVSTGINGQKGGRKAPSFVNAAFSFSPLMFWDGRAANLEEQAKGPMVNPIEMGNPDHDVVIERLKKTTSYATFFQKAFGDPAITIDRVAAAIADYERTRVSGNSPWDQYKEGKGTISDAAKLGETVFFGKAKCATCHVGQWFSDAQYHNLGVGYDPATSTFKDKGRHDVTKKDEDQGAFKTPGLRDVALHAPYMHDGSQLTLKDTVEHYRKGGTPNPFLDKKMMKLDLTEAEADALVAFMESLTGEGYLDEAPAVFPE